MATFKDEAIVLRAFDLGEADRIISLITSAHGLRRAVARGVKRTRSKFGGRLEPFTQVRAVLHEGRNLDTVVQADAVRTHAALRGDYARFLYGEAMLELIEKSLQERQEVPRLFDILRVTLDVLEGEVAEPPLLLTAFALKVCALIGYRPHLDCCLHCGREVAGIQVFLDLAEGGVACPRCLPSRGERVRLRPEALDLMRGLMRGEMAAVARMGCGRPETAREALTASLGLAEAFLERPLRARGVIMRHLAGEARRPCAASGAGDERGGHPHPAADPEGEKKRNPS